MEQEKMRREQTDREADLKAMADQDMLDAEAAAKLEKVMEEARVAQARQERVTTELEANRAKQQELLKAVQTDMEGLYQSRGRDADKKHRLELNRAKMEGDLRALQERIWNTYEMTYAAAEEFRQREGFNAADADRQVESGRHEDSRRAH